MQNSDQIIRVAIIDDDPEVHATLEKYIKKSEHRISIIANCYDARSGKQALLSQQPDILFLDIQMPDFNGFELLESLPEQEFTVIIITAHHEYAIKAIKASALDFLLKPFSFNEFSLGIAKHVKVGRKQDPTARQLLSENLSALELKKLIVPTEDGMHVVPVGEIVWCKADSVYTHITLSDGSHILSSKPLKEYEQLLPPTVFVRVHKSYLVHLKHVRKYTKGRSGELLLTDGTTVPLARNRKQLFLDRLQLFSFQNPG